uniref:Calcium-binding mitochondrial carrier protein Aralar1-like n=1 Tax=Phallusia mammillata TaxID=59560 RepID=A0A6F9DT19_9ASCI|nr:calcium-binding mitochondrial carrier protein Aralar1-like [Phallusia mammillata]
METSCLSPPETKQGQPFVSGAIASVAAELTTFPIDLAKTRLQIQGQVFDSRYTKLKYRNPLHAIVKICKHEGFTALYRGCAPAVFRQIVYGGLKRWTYKNLNRSYNGVQSFSSNLAFAFISGSSSAAMCNPVDILKVRMQTQGMTLSNSSKQLIQDGFKGCFRGVSPNIWRTGVLVGVTFSVYDESTRILRHNFGDWYITSYVISSSFASILGTVFVNPFDVTKSRMMNQSLHNVRYTSMWHCIYETYKAEGFRAFYKGYLANLFRSVPWHFVFFLVTDFVEKR